ncbi:hypothetical protein FHS88_004050 [Roseomonas alkaliterrae]|uniref:Uncharacterized protein n=1 Tax=Neoroseomonas alkaliterrae TaxID=1452450 RepID=A0A840XZ56_9PROT|nr:hypothetical protein [Neoroseomonas alkaliterrae]MBB5691889.1 hypothetical protein [Neoroseomonas alkaliterrae]
MRSYGLRVAPAVVLLLGLSACGGGSAPPPTASVPPAASAPAAPAAPAWQDLNGARASSGEGELQRRGFELSRRQGLTQFWNHAPSRTCLRVVTSQGRYAVTQVPFTPQNCPV